MKPNNLWHYIEDGEQKGPVEKKRLIEQIANGGLARNVMVWSPGMGNWMPASEVPEIAELIPPRLPHIPPPPPAPVSAQQSNDNLLDRVGQNVSGQPAEDSVEASVSEWSSGNHVPHRQRIGHFVALNVFTLGIYQLYWTYKTWKWMKEENSLNVSPFWRAVFAPFFFYALATRVFELASSEGRSDFTNPGWRAVAYFALTASWRLPDPLYLVSLLNFLVMLKVVEARNVALACLHPRSENRVRLTAGEWVVMSIFPGLVLLTFLGAL